MKTRGEGNAGIIARWRRDFSLFLPPLTSFLSLYLSSSLCSLSAVRVLHGRRGERGGGAAERENV